MDHYNIDEYDAHEEQQLDDETEMDFVDALKQRDDARKERDALRDKVERLESDIEQGTYRGNSPQHWHVKAKAYGDMVHGVNPILGAMEGETTKDAARRIVKERDDLRTEREHLIAVIRRLDHGGAAEIDCPLCGHVFDYHEDDCPLLPLTCDLGHDPLNYVRRRVKRAEEYEAMGLSYSNARRLAERDMETEFELARLRARAEAM